MISRALLLGVCMLDGADAFGYTPVQRAYGAIQLLGRYSVERARC